MVEKEHPSRKNWKFRWKGMLIMRRLSTIFFSTVATIAVVTQAQEPAVARLDSALEDIVPPAARVEQLADSPGPGHREGPVWIRKGGYLLYSDLGAKAINKWSPADGKVSTFLENTDSDGVTLDRQGRIVWAGGGQVVRVEKDGQRTVLASQYQGKPLNAPNDLVYKSDGALYFTDTGHGSSNDPKALPSGDIPVVYLLRDGTLRVATTVITRPNGLAFSPGEKYLYVNSSNKLTITRFDVLPDGTITHGRVLIDMNGGKPYPVGSPDPDRSAGYPDGMKVDRKGNVYCTGPEGVWIISPEGKHLGTIVGLNRPTNLAFGGPDGKTLFITSRPGLYRIRLKIPGIRP
jgi:gluconolactonase